MPRKTQAQRRAEREEAEGRYWTEFSSRLEQAAGLREAAALVAAAPAQNTPGRKFHSNLGRFLGSFSRPFGASSAECELYRRLLARMDEAHQLKPGIRQRAEADLGPRPN